MSRMMPETKFSQKPNHMIGRKRFISTIGTFGAAPRIRKAIAALMPADNPIPTVWQERIVGKAKTVGAPRTQSLNAVDSTHAVKWRSCCTSGPRYHRIQEAARPESSDAGH